MRKMINWLRGNSPFPFLVLALTFIVGILFWGAFNWSLEITNTQSFCVSCHEMRDNVFPEYKKSVHFANRTGVRASCPDCHVPRDWGHKVIRKIMATNELYHWLIGSVNTPEKFNKARPLLAGKVWATMKATDSRECRNCHAADYMDAAAQSDKASHMHSLAQGWGMTCIECHQGIAHNLPRGFDKELVMDDVHDRIKKEKVDCKICHKSIRRARSDDGW